MSDPKQPPEKLLEMGEPVGWAMGPGDTVKSFDFVTHSIENLIAGEFVYYEREDAESGIVCRILDHERLSASREELSEELRNQVSEELLSSVDSNDAHLFSVKIIGAYDHETDYFRNLHQPPSVGKRIYLPTDETLSHILSPSKEKGLMHLGSLLKRNSDVEVHADMDRIATTHLGVLASTGSGKSYTVGVILEEMMKPSNRGTAVVFDLHGEYYPLAEHEKYSDKVNHIKLPQIKVSKLGVGDFEVAFPEELSDVQSERLRDVIGRLRIDLPHGVSPTEAEKTGKVRVNYSLEDIRDKLAEGNKIDDALRWRIQTIKEFESLHVESETKIEEMCEPSKCNIIEFPPGANEHERNLIVWHFMKRLLEARRNAVRAQKSDMDKEIGESTGYESRAKIDIPVFTVLEEAHNFAPNYREIKTRSLLREIAREGRKFGVGLCVVTQRPSRLDQDVLSQCNSTVIMKVRNGVDQDAIRRTVEEAGEDLIKDLPGLTVGQAVLAGNFVNTPILAEIRKRETEHGGKTPTVSEVSTKKYREKKGSGTKPGSNQQRRNRDSSDE